MLLSQLSTLVVILVSLFASSYSLSLGLGEVTLKSSYNEPLVAELKIIQSEGLSQSEILVALASREDFSRVGIDRVFFLTNLTFTVIFDDPSNAYVSVTTREPVQEPYLNFLVKIQWPSGRLLREYTLLLDIPLPDNQNASSEPNQNLSQASITSSDISAQPFNEMSVIESKPLSNIPESSKNNTSTNEMKVMPGDTLWDLARKMRPNESLNILQTMMAIQDVNPDAFIDGNINLLRTGAMLKAPTLSDIESTNYQKAAVAVKQQTDNWQLKEEQYLALSKVPPTSNLVAELDSEEGRAASEPTPSSNASAVSKSVVQRGSDEVLQSELGIDQKELDQPPQFDVASNSSPSLSPDSRIGRVTLGPNDFSGSSDLMKNLGQRGSSDEVQNELAITQKKLNQSLQENDNLQDRLVELEDVVRLTSRQLAVLEYQILALQGRFSIDTPPATMNDDDINTIVTTDARLAKSEVNKGIATGSTTAGVGFNNNTFLSDKQASARTSHVLYAVVAALLMILTVFWLLARSGGLLKKYDDRSVDFTSVESDLEPYAAVIDSESPSSSSETDNFNLYDTQAAKENENQKSNFHIGLVELGKTEKLPQIKAQKSLDNADVRLAKLDTYLAPQNPGAFNDQYHHLSLLNNHQIKDTAQFLREGLYVAGGMDSINNIAAAPEDTTATLTERELDDLLGDGFDDIIDDDDDHRNAEAAAEKLSVDELLNKNLDSYFLDSDEDDDLKNMDARPNENLNNEESTNYNLSLNNKKNSLKTAVEPQLTIQGDAKNQLLESTQVLRRKNESDSIDSSSVDPSIDEPFNFYLPPSNVDMASLALELDEMSAMLDEPLSIASAVEPEIKKKVMRNVGELDKVEDDVLDIITEDEVQIDVSRQVDVETITVAESREIVAPIHDVGDDDMHFVTSEDDVGTKLDLAQAYIDMGDLDGAEDILHEVIEEGDDEQKILANKLFESF